MGRLSGIRTRRDKVIDVKTKFIAVHQAYEILKDENTRRTYDSHGLQGVFGGVMELPSRSQTSTKPIDLFSQPVAHLITEEYHRLASQAIPARIIMKTTRRRLTKRI